MVNRYRTIYQFITVFSSPTGDRYTTETYVRVSLPSKVAVRLPRLPPCVTDPPDHFPQKGAVSGDACCRGQVMMRLICVML